MIWRFVLITVSWVQTIRTLTFRGSCIIIFSDYFHIITRMDTYYHCRVYRDSGRNFSYRRSKFMDRIVKVFSVSLDCKESDVPLCQIVPQWRNKDFDTPVNLQICLRRRFFWHGLYLNDCRVYCFKCVSISFYMELILIYLLFHSFRISFIFVRPTDIEH